MSSFLTEGGPAVKLEVGETFEGTVLSISELDDRKPDGEVQTWGDGTPKKVWVFNMTPTGSEETVSLWVRSNLVKVVREAAREAKVADLVGCALKVQRIEDGKPTQKGYNPPKLYQAKVTPGAPKATSSFVQAVEEDPF